MSWPSSWGDVLRNLDGCHAGDSSSLMGRNNEGAACTVCHADLSGCATGTAVASVAVNLVFWLAWVVPTFCWCLHFVVATLVPNGRLHCLPAQDCCSHWVGARRQERHSGNAADDTTGGTVRALQPVVDDDDDDDDDDMMMIE